MSMTLAASMAMQQMQDSQMANNVIVQGMHQMSEEEGRLVNQMNTDEAQTRTEILKKSGEVLQRLSFS